MTKKTLYAAVAGIALALAGCTTRTVYVGAGAHSPRHARAASSPSPSLPPGVKDGPNPGTYYVNCSVGQRTTQPGAGPFGTTCSTPSTDEQLCSRT